jgi:hypothetical protein
MSVHVGELHTDVVPIVAGGQAAGPTTQDEHLRFPDERWQEHRDRSRWLERRVAAENFDD